MLTQPDGDLAKWTGKARLTAGDKRDAYPTIHSSP